MFAVSLSSALRLTLLLLGWVLLLTTSSCSKDAVAPVQRPGHIQGSVRPARAASAVTLTAADGQVTTVTPDAAGAFTFPDLVPGTYSLAGVATSSYNTPAPISLLVQAGETAPATLNFARSFRIQGTMSWQLNGTQYTATVLAGSFRNEFFSLEGRTAPDANGVAHSVSLVLGSVPVMPNPFQGAGQYPLGLSEYTFGLLGYYRGTARDEYYTGTGGSQVGQVLMRRYDFSGLTASGTFEFTAVPTINGTGTVSPTRSVTDGQFDITF